MSFIDFITEKEFKGVYMAMHLSKESEVVVKQYQKIIQEQFDIPNDLISTDLHCTLIYSKREFSGEVDLSNIPVECTVKGLAYYGENKDYLVLELESKELHDRNRKLVQSFGFIGDFQYNPHITIAKSFTGAEIADLPVPPYNIILENEYIDEVKND